MKTLLTLSVAFALLASATALADARAVRVSLGNNCIRHTLCAAYNITGGAVCENAAGDEIVASIQQISNIVFEHDESVGNHTCDIGIHTLGFDAAVGTPDKINTSSLTQANLAPATSSSIRGRIWATCSVGASVTIYATVCPVR